ncbi:non-homologous end-joining DNA ligase [Aggregatilinea lenta]|uniref:non-homologous end-joining DNA ligase n=1 Tax=Aggregatilinea lenta TaxID=913108 RepID=UPI000E5B1582|nr:non-homologous end-joining DNA ligase [Aggregatilinea lenta]
MADRVEIGAHTVALTSADRIYFPETGITKGALVDYYRRIADTMLPHLHDRPLTLHRFPDGVGENGFFQQNASDYFPEWIARVEVAKEDGQVAHVMANDAASLVYLANQGVIVFHAWLSRAGQLDTPDRLILDLDPSGTDLAVLRRAARDVGDFMREVGLVPHVMTTGSSGFHVAAPLKREHPFDVVRAFARDLADLLARRDPDHLTTEQRKRKRENRIFLDTLRNSYAHTAVAPYSVRAKEGAPVAAPLDWSELDGVTPQQYTITNLFRRLAQKPDPWRDMQAHAVALDGPRRALDALLDEDR